jgi:hypothetical protein
VFFASFSLGKSKYMHYNKENLIKGGNRWLIKFRA